MPTKSRGKKQIVLASPSDNTITDRDEPITEELSSMLEDTIVQSEDENTYDSRVSNLEKAIEHIQTILEKQEQSLNNIENKIEDFEKNYNELNKKKLIDNKEFRELDEKFLQYTLKNELNKNCKNFDNNSENVDYNNFVSIEQFAQLQTEFRQLVISHNNLQLQINDKVEQLNSKVDDSNESETRSLFKSKSDKLVNNDLKQHVTSLYETHKRDIKDFKKEVLNILEEIKCIKTDSNIEQKLIKHKESITNEFDNLKKEINARVMVTTQRKQTTMQRRT